MAKKIDPLLAKINEQRLQNFRDKKRLKEQGIAPNLDPSNYYNGNHLMGHDYAVFHLLYGTGGVGKSYWALNHIMTAKMKNPDKVKIYWCRLTEEALRVLKKKKDGNSLVDAGIRKKINDYRQSKGLDEIHYRIKGDTIEFGTKSQVFTKKGTPKVKANGELEYAFEKLGTLAELKALSTFYNNKGEAMFDQNYQGKYYIILDEMNREKGEANRFDIVKAFTNQLETMCRNGNLKNIKVICIGNNTQEMSDLLASFNFIPPAGQYGIWKLKRRRCVIEVIKPSEHYTATKNQRVGALLSPDDERYAETQIFKDNDLIVPQYKVREKSPRFIIRFSKKQSDWFVLNKGDLITRYNGEQKDHFGIFRNLDCTYRKEVVDYIQNKHDNMELFFDNESTCVKFKVSISKLRHK